MGNPSIVAEASESEKHTDDLECILLHGGLLYTAADDGKVKVWTSELTLQKEIQAHDYAVNHLLVYNNTLFTASVDSTIKTWELPDLRPKDSLSAHEDAVRRLATNGNNVYSGDDQGKVYSWSSTLKPVSMYDVVEEVWDMAVRSNVLYTVRDRGLSVTEMKESENQYSIIKSMPGRAPLYISDDFLVFMESAGVNIQVHRNTPMFDRITELKGHEKIVTSMAGYKMSDGKEYLVTGGWDPNIIIWDLINGSRHSTCPVPSYIGALAGTTDGTVYAGGSSGRLFKIAAN